MEHAIKDVVTKSLKWLKDDRGQLMEILRHDEEIFKGFGQVYVTTCKPGFVKAWHFHVKQDDSFIPLVGTLRVGLYDSREGSPTHGQASEYILSADDPYLLQIPKGVMHGFECVGDAEAMVMNVPDQAYNHDDPDELRVDPFDNDIPFTWQATRGG